MADEQCGEAELVLQLGEQLEHARLDGHVEGGRGFVGHDQFGLQRQAAGQRAALTLTAGQFVRIAVGVFGRQLHGVEQTHNFTAAIAFAHARPVHPEGLGDAVADRQVRIERGGRVLEDEADLFAQRLEFLFFEADHFLIEDPQGASAGASQAGDCTADRGFA